MSPQEVPLLRSISGAFPLYFFQSEAYLTRAKVTLTLHTPLQCLSILPEPYASHSFGIGFTTTAAKAGLPPWLFQTLGCWSSNCFTPYIQTPPFILQKVPGMLATASYSHLLPNIARTLQGVLPPSPFYARVHQQPVVPFTAKYCVPHSYAGSI